MVAKPTKTTKVSRPTKSTLKQSTKPMASKKFIGSAVKSAVKSAAKAGASSYLKNKASGAQKKADFYQKMRDEKQQSPSYKGQYFGYREYDVAARNLRKKANRYNNMANRLSK